MSELKRIFDNMGNIPKGNGNSELKDLFDRISKGYTEQSIQTSELNELFQKIQAGIQVKSILDEKPTRPNKKIF